MICGHANLRTAHRLFAPLDVREAALCEGTNNAARDECCEKHNVSQLDVRGEYRLRQKR